MKEISFAMLCLVEMNIPTSGVRRFLAAAGSRRMKELDQGSCFAIGVVCRTAVIILSHSGEKSGDSRQSHDFPKA